MRDILRGGWREGRQDGGMHIAFVDESGDVGTRGSPTRHFVLCAVVVEHARWAEVNDGLGAMRERLRAAHGLRTDAEIHASEFLGGSPLHLGLGIRARFQCTLHLLRTLRGLDGICYARVAVDKTVTSEAIMNVAWGGLLDDIGEALSKVTRTTCPSRGLVVVCDHHAAAPYRPSAEMMARLDVSAKLLDLPYGRDSQDNLVLQAVDMLAFLTKQSLEPRGRFTKSANRSLVRESDRLFGGPCRIAAP